MTLTHLVLLSFLGGASEAGGGTPTVAIVDDEFNLSITRRDAFNLSITRADNFELEINRSDESDFLLS